MRAREPGGAQIRHRAVEVGWLALMLLPGALTAFLGFRSGGFYVGVASLVAAEMATVVALRLSFARRPFEGASLALIGAVVSMGGFAAWALISSGWSDSTARALPEYSRALLYGLTLLFFGMLPFSVRRVRWMVYGVAAAIVVICGAAVIARTLPDVIFDSALVDEPRLGYPLTYWNALGILAAVGSVFCAHLAADERGPRMARVLGAAALPLLALTLYYTLSRGGIWLAVAALVIYALVGRPRGLLGAVVAVVPATVIVLSVASPADPVTVGYPVGVTEAGKHVIRTLVACMVGAGALRALLLPLDRRLASLHLSASARRPVMVGVAAGLLAVVMVAGMAANAPDVALTKFRDFTSGDKTQVGDTGESRLVSASVNGRFGQWGVSLDAFRADPVKGSGAGTYDELWMRDRPRDSYVHDAHSLYVEVLGELGLVGFLPLVVVLVLIVGGFASRARGPDRALFAALLAAGVAWVVHAGVDWDWEMPAVTLWLFALGGAALAQVPRENRPPGRGMVVARVTGVVACLGLAVLPARLAISDAHLNSAIDDVRNGDCRDARAEARDAIDAVGQRPTPYQLIAFCYIGTGRYRAAVPRMREALERDPHSWELRYGMAVARGSVGLDPRTMVRQARTLNPREPLLVKAATRFRKTGARSWELAARSAPLLPPTEGDP